MTVIDIDAFFDELKAACNIAIKSGKKSNFEEALKMARHLETILLKERDRKKGNA